MNKDYDMNLSEENNYSITSNEELQDMPSFTDGSTSVVASSSFPSINGIYDGANNQYYNYRNSTLHPTANHSIVGIYNPQGSSSDNEMKQENFLQYIDEFTKYLYKYNPQALEYLQSNINKHLNGEFNEIGRTTPLLFPEMHAIAKLDFPGLIYKLMPSTLGQSGGIIEINDEIYPKDYDFHTDDYPGPLTIERTTEDQIFFYFNNEMETELQDTSPMDWDSGHLLMKYLELLIKEEGKPRISNIVKLLNEGIDIRTYNLRKENKPFDSISRNSFSRASSRASSRAVSPENRDSIDNDLPQNALDYPRGPGSVTSMVRRAINNVSHDQKLNQNMDKFRENILSGRLEEAINFAIRVGIWDHAFALALRMNNPTLVNEILVRFSRRAICGNDPIFTMHELLAAKLPRIVTANNGFSSSEMRDWQAHLSMILAVKKFRPEESRKAIESMGEKLLLLRNYFGAHLCFLLAGTMFGIDKSAHKYRRKFDLIGWYSSTSTIPVQKSSYEYCHKLFSGHNYWVSAPEKYIKLTEIYEYALRLRGDGSHKLVSVHLLPYKYLMAYRMEQRQQIRTAYEYCRQIGEILGYSDILWLECESLNFKMVSNIRVISYQLHSQLTGDEYDNDLTDDCTWLNNLDLVYCQFCQKLNVWNPLLSKSDFLINVAEYEATESVSDSCSQIRQEFPELPNNGNNATTDFFYAQQSQQDDRNQRSIAHHSRSPENNLINFQSTQILSDNQGMQQSQPRYPVVANNMSKMPPQSDLPSMTYPQPRRVDRRNTPQFDGTIPNENKETFNPGSYVSHQSRPTSGDGINSLPPKTAFEPQFHQSLANQTTNPTQSSMFRPVTNQDRQYSNETIDCFTSSQSQSNGPDARTDMQANQSAPVHPVTRSRLNSESKDKKMPVPSKPVQSTKAETERDKEKKLKAETAPAVESKSSWFPPIWPTTKAAFLPNDTEPLIQYDEKKKRWIDKSNPEEDKPLTPPPMMPQLQSSFTTPSSQYQGNPSTISKYRHAAINVKPSLNVASPDMPVFKVPSAFSQATPQNNSHEPNNGRLFSRTESNHNVHSNQINGFNTLPQSHDSSRYQNNEE